jgi:hypothetical protein
LEDDSYDADSCVAGRVLPEENSMTAVNKKPTNSGIYAAQVAKTSAGRPKIGQILIEAGFMDQPALAECLNVAKQFAQPVGRVISMLNYVSERDVESALVVQSLIGQGRLSKQRAIQSLREASRRKIAVVELLKAFGSGIHASVAVTETDIGKLLTESCLITHDQLSHALNVSQESGLLLCRSLLVTNAITIHVASKALNALAQVKAGKITHIQAVAALDEIRKTSCPLRDALKKLKVAVAEPEDYLLLGEIIARSGLSTEIEILGAVEMALVEGRKLGDTLVACNVISQEMLESALELQELASKCVILADQSVFVLKRLHRDNLSVAQFAAQTDLFEDKSPIDREVLKFLCASNALSEQDILDAVKAKANYRMGPIKALLAMGMVSPALYRSAQDFVSLVLDRKVTESDGIKALTLCRTEGLSFTSALASVGRSLTNEEMDIPVEFHQDQTSKEASRAKHKRWFKLAEFQLLMMLGMVTLSGSYMCFTYAPEPFNVIGVWGIFLVASVALMLIGISWRSSEESMAHAAAETVDSAREMKARLSKRRK